MPRAWFDDDAFGFLCSSGQTLRANCLSGTYCTDIPAGRSSADPGVLPDLLVVWFAGDNPFEVVGLCIAYNQDGFVIVFLCHSFQDLPPSTFALPGFSIRENGYSLVFSLSSPANLSSVVLQVMVLTIVNIYTRIKCCLGYCNLLLQPSRSYQLKTE